jgi:hypothetical protein
MKLVDNVCIMLVGNIYILLIYFLISDMDSSFTDHQLTSTTVLKFAADSSYMLGNKEKFTHKCIHSYLLRYLDSNNNDPETSINKDQHGNAEIGIQLINATTNDDESHLKIYFESLGAQY